MVGEGDIFGDLVVAVVLNHCDGDFQAVYGALLHGGKNLAPGHGYRVSTQGAEHAYEHGIQHDSPLDAFHISGRVDGPHIIDHLPEAAFSEPKSHDILFQQFVHEGFSQSSIQHFMGLGLVGIEKGHVIDLECRFNTGDGRIGDHRHVYGTEAEAFQHFLFVSQLAVGIELYIELSGRRHFQSGPELPGCGGIGIGSPFRCGPAELDGHGPGKGQ